jgi:solute carrier family 25 (mitochondrial S-adenosylmethionine transporter), member 26
MPSVGLYFGVYSYCKRRIGTFLEETLGTNTQHQINSQVLWTFSVTTSAAIGNTVASFSRVPYEVVKQKLQTGMYDTTWQALKHMSQTGGLRAFFPLGGVPIQMMRDIPYAMATLLCYECLQRSVVKYQNLYPKQWLDAFAGAIAGGIGSYVTNPMDVIKTRLQMSSGSGSVAACFVDTWNEGGPSAFLRGSVPRLLHKVPANGFFFLFYEFFKTVLNVDGAGK